MLKDQAAKKYSTARNAIAFLPPYFVFIKKGKSKETLFLLFPSLTKEFIKEIKNKTENPKIKFSSEH